MVDETTDTDAPITPTVGQNDGALPPEPVIAAPAAAVVGNAPDPALPSGGDTVTGDGVSLAAITHPEGAAPLPDDAEPAEHTIVDIDQDPAIAAYEADRLAAIEAGDTSWPTWGFLDLDKKLTYLLKSDAINSDKLG